MFKVNAKVSHPGHGACTVSDICKLDLTGTEVEYYKLTPCYGGSETVYTPVSVAAKIGMRHVISKDHATELLYSLREADEKWHSDNNEKQKRYRSLFANNDVVALNDMLSAMSAIIKLNEKKPLGSADKSMLETIQNKVLPELAVALNVSVADVSKKAKDLILEPQ